MVPGGGFEPPTRGFSIRCSTPELPGHLGYVERREGCIVVRERSVYDEFCAFFSFLGLLRPERFADLGNLRSFADNLV